MVGCWVLCYSVVDQDRVVLGGCFVVLFLIDEVFFCVDGGEVDEIGFVVIVVFELQVEVVVIVVGWGDVFQCVDQVGMCELWVGVV